jgi:hypothetical protein
MLSCEPFDRSEQGGEAMIALSVAGLRWCEHAGWLLVLCDPRGERQLQVTLSLPDALALGHELAGRCTERTGLYGLVGALLRQQPRLASINFTLGEAQRAKVALVVDEDGGARGYPTTTADGVALAVRANLPLFADEALMEAFAVATDPRSDAVGAGAHHDAVGAEARPAKDHDTAPGSAAHDAGPGVSAIPEAFRLALDEPSS